jgi:hypothetical protein
MEFTDFQSFQVYGNYLVTAFYVKRSAHGFHRHLDRAGFTLPIGASASIEVFGSSTLTGKLGWV